MPATSAAATFDETCAAIAASHGLTPREADVMRLLARGRNNAVIQDELVLSRNTVKTYIKHVYAKLNVHNQQEVIDLVDRSPKASRA